MYKTAGKYNEELFFNNLLRRQIKLLLFTAFCFILLWNTCAWHSLLFQSVPSETGGQTLSGLLTVNWKETRPRCHHSLTSEAPSSTARSGSHRSWGLTIYKSWTVPLHELQCCAAAFIIWKLSTCVTVQQMARYVLPAVNSWSEILFTCVGLNWKEPLTLIMSPARVLE